MIRSLRFTLDTDAILQMSMSSLLRQDRSDGRQGGRVQPQLFHGCAKCQGAEGGRRDSASIGDAAYLDIRLVVNRSQGLSSTWSGSPLNTDWQRSARKTQCFELSIWHTHALTISVRSKPSLLTQFSSTNKCPIDRSRADGHDPGSQSQISSLLAMVIAIPLTIHQLVFRKTKISFRKQTKIRSRLTSSPSS